MAKARRAASYSELYEEGKVDYINCLASFLNTTANMKLSN